MDWILVIVILAGPAPAEMPVGHMLDARTCAIAGAGMAQVLSRANPGLAFGWRCELQVRA